MALDHMDLMKVMQHGVVLFFAIFKTVSRLCSEKMDYQATNEVRDWIETRVARLRDNLDEKSKLMFLLKFQPH